MVFLNNIYNMKYLRKYNENIDTFDVDFAIIKIKEKFPKVKEMLGKEVLMWTHPKDGSSYSDRSNNEAEDIIITHLINWYSSEHPYSDENKETLIEAIQKLLI
jgi:hypothetical protein